ncbi:diguanylate cyclase domain-containing protein [Pseudomonas sp. nanlin1]|uniref:GGDEF domain-containing protein n=1 Tax=Pseudomonas sp. nanlin1 TaxID=3040605 RepID=UPI00388EE073
MNLPEHALSRPPPIPAPLRPAFNAYVLKHYRGFLLAINLIAAAAFMAYVIADALLIPDMAQASLITRLSMVTLGLFDVFILFRYSRNVVLLDQLMPFHDILSTVAWFELLKHSTSPDVPSFVFASVIFIILCNLGVRVSLRGTLVCSLLIVALTLGNVVLLHPGDARSVLVFSVVYLPVVAFSLFIGWHNIMGVRRAFYADLEQQRQQFELSALNLRLQALAVTDALTGVGNRRAFDLRLAQHWDALQAQGQGFALLLLDIDYFKPFNDHYGHPAGDLCLIRVATTLVNSLDPAQSQIFRYGGEEFAILVPVTDPLTLSRMANSLVQTLADLRIEHRHRIDGDDGITISVGAALAQSPEVVEAHDLIELCDRLLYQAKQQGRNRACV